MRRKCAACGRRVTDDAKSRLKHIAKFHPERLAPIISGLILNPERARDMGRTLGEYLKGLYS